MRVLAKKTLRKFWEQYSDAEKPLRDWHRRARKEDWDSPEKLNAAYSSVRTIADDRAIFNIKGNKYRLVVKIKYSIRIVYIRFVGTHAEYSRINAKEV